MGRIFGTDGVRGIANSELTCELAMSIGRALAVIMKKDSGVRPRIIVGGDTRLSSEMLASAVMSGICSMGADAVYLGVCATPAVAFLVKSTNADAGIMISASHNPSEYNGIKIFSADGYKLPDALEDRIETMILMPEKYLVQKDGEIGRVIYSAESVDYYAGCLSSIPDVSFSGMRIALDCANGSACRTAEAVFSSLGAEVYVLFDKPDGKNINRNCGSTHIGALSKYVVENGLDAGFAFDGDADRCMCVDENGELIDGDMILAVCASSMQKMGTLKNGTVVGTVMTNFGFTKFCESSGLKFVPTKVGDRYVLEEMLAGGYNLGGEQSGHIIFGDYATTGDGQLTALIMLSELKRSGKRMSELSAVMRRSPQVLINLTVSNEAKLKYHTDSVIRDETARLREKLGDGGRILVRPSGTEPLIRVMAEGESEALISEVAQELADIIQSRLSNI